jgi:hypothetical protein
MSPNIMPRLMHSANSSLFYSIILRFFHLSILPLFLTFVLSYLLNTLIFRLPKIPETLGRQIVFESTDIDTSTIPYQHKERETARKNKMEKVKKEKADMIAQEALDAAEDEDSDDEEVTQPHIMTLPSSISIFGHSLYLHFCFYA